MREEFSGSGFLIVLQQGVASPAGAEDYVLFSIDPFSGFIPYAFRYLGTNQRENLGMELDGPTGLIAATIRSTQGLEQATLLRFDQFAGLPLFHWQYPQLVPFIQNPGLYDVMVYEPTGEIFAVGYADLEPGPFPFFGRQLLLAKFDPNGFPLFFNVYGSFLPAFPNEFESEVRGVSIEIGPGGEIAVVGPRLSNILTTHAFHMTVDPIVGAPLASTVIISPEGQIVPASSSLELLPDNTHITSGTFIDVQGQRSPAMWDVDGAFTFFNWWYSPDPMEGVGNGYSAIPNTPDDLLLGGDVFPITPGPIGGARDALMVQTRDYGYGLCPFVPPLIIEDAIVEFLPFDVQPIPLPFPVPTQLERVPFQPLLGDVCQPCFEDVNDDGVVDLADLLQVLSFFGGGPGGDVNQDGVTDLADLLAVLAAFGTPCP